MNSPFPPGARLAAYLRDSGSEDQDFSVDQQHQAVSAWCLINGCLITRVYTDRAAPGSTTIGRDQFLKLIHDLRQPDAQIDGLILR